MSNEKWLITGIEGFVGSHLQVHLLARKYKVYGTSWEQKYVDDQNVFLLYLTDKNQIEEVMTRVKPDFLVLLAGFSSMRDSFDKREECLQANCESTRHFLNAIQKLRLNTKVLTVSSAMVYCPSDEMLDETSPVCNSSPYAESKIKQEGLIKEFPEIPIINSRSFNHTGPGQNSSFLIPKLAQAFVEAPGNEVELTLGDIDAERDFLDVRDVCEAYRILLEENPKHKIYNVCSSKCWSIREVIALFEKISGKKALFCLNHDFAASAERKRILGNNQRILAETSWRPKIPFEITVGDIYQYWKNKYGK